MKTNPLLFNQQEWQSPQPGLRFKIFRDGLKQFRLVEFSTEFVELDWCENGHDGFVLEGELEVDFAGEVVRFPAGSALTIPPGKAHAHKARAVTPMVRLFLVEEISI